MTVHDVLLPPYVWLAALLAVGPASWLLAPALMRLEQKFGQPGPDSQLAGERHPYKGVDS